MIERVELCSLTSSAFSGIADDGALHAHRRGAVDVWTEAGYLDEPVPAVERNGGALLVAGLQTQHANTVGVGVPQQRVDECVSNTAAAMLRLDVEPLELAGPVCELDARGA